jgi:hypothetical protein
MKKLGRLLRVLPSPVVPSSYRLAGMACQPLRGREVGTGIQKVGDGKSAPDVSLAGQDCAFSTHFCDSLDFMTRR